MYKNKLFKIYLNKVNFKEFIMNEILKTTLLGLFFGTFGTTLGGILGIVIKKNLIKTAKICKY